MKRTELLPRRAVWLSMCLFLASACTLQAQEWPEVPARFVRVTSMSNVARAGFYAIGASDTDGHYLMRQTPAVNYDGKQTVAAAGEQRDAYSLSTSDNFWLIEPDGTDWTIKGEKGYLIPEGNNNFTLSSQPETWRFAENGDGTFTLTATGSPNQRVSVTDRSGTHYFGRFSNTDSRTKIYLYRLETEHAQLPADQTCVALCAATENGFTAVAEDLATMNDISRFRLANDTLTPDGDFARWTVQHESDGKFRLSRKDGLRLGVVDRKLALLGASEDAATLWCIADGLITTAGTASEPLVLCADNSNGQSAPALRSSGEFQESGSATMLFRTVGNEAQYHTDAQGTAVLTGAWSAAALESLPLAGLTALDLSHISLPRTAATLLPENPNTLIYIRHDETGFVPTEWKNVIATEGETGTALTHISLTDRVPFHTPHPFIAAQGITYNREAFTDGGWETLCLPFDVSRLPDGFIFEKAENFNGDEITFSPTDEIVANSPVIFISATEKLSTGNATLNIQANDVCVDTQKKPSASPLRGNYTNFTVDSLIGSCYLLNESGTAFVMADASSALAPFRAYLFDNHSGTTVRVFHSPATATGPIIRTDRKNWIYGIDGRHYPENYKEKGKILIYNKKKVIR